MHEGHRKRMYEKLKSDSTLAEHEVLEILLFNALPRKNTNPLAHTLLQTFGSISNVLSADVAELTSIDGIGENAAYYLKCVGKCMEYASGSPAKGIAVLRNYQDFTAFVCSRMRNKTEEVLEFYFMDKSGRIDKVYSFCSKERTEVSVDAGKIAGLISTFKPYGLMMAHNHIIGDSAPSERDDKFTLQVQLLCSVNNVCLYDHCIYSSDEDIYSYFTEGRIDEMKKKFTLDKVVDAGLNSFNIK